MARVRARGRPPITRQPIPPDTVFRQSTRLLFFKDPRPERRAEPLVARVPSGLPFPAIPACQERHSERTGPLPRSALGLLPHRSVSWLVQRVRAAAQWLRGELLRGQPSTVLHTDICSPVATDPTWTGLDPAVQKALEKDGGPLWHSLLKTLRPQIVILSVARRHLSRIRFRVLSGWRVVRVFEQTQAGTPRKQPVMVSARWCEISGEPSLLAFVPAAQKPLGRLGSIQKREAGVVALEVLQRGR